MAGYDINLFSERLGQLYYGNFRATLAQIKFYSNYYNRPIGKKSVARPTVSQNYRKFFSGGTKFNSSSGHTQGWARNMTLKGGQNGNMNFSRVKYRDFDGKIHKDSSKSRWGANINQKGNGPNTTTVLHGTKGWLRQLMISNHALYINAEAFRIVVGRRALKVFQTSFRERKFHSAGSSPWAPLSAFTLKKRLKRGTGNKILREYGDLYNSIKIDEGADPITTRVYTDVVHENVSHHKRHSICYAGYHNEGRGTYGNGWGKRRPKAYIRRQFMGHSSYLNPFTDRFLRKMMKIYLFDAVFLVKKA